VNSPIQSDLGTAASPPSRQRMDSLAACHYLCNAHCSHSAAGTLHPHCTDGHTTTAYTALIKRRAIKIYQVRIWPTYAVGYVKCGVVRVTTQHNTLQLLHIPLRREKERERVTPHSSRYSAAPHGPLQKNNDVIHKTGST